MNVYIDSQVPPKNDLLMSSKVWFVFLDFHHQVMEVYELRAHCQTAKRGLGEDLMETMIVLDELGQCSLEDTTRQQLISLTAHL